MGGVDLAQGIVTTLSPACAPRTSHGIGITVIANAFLAPSAKLHTFNWKTQSSEQGCVKKQQGVFFLDPLKASATDLQCLLGVVPLVTAICRPRLINTSKWDGECHNIQCYQNIGFWNSQLQGSTQMYVWFVKICPEILQLVLCSICWVARLMNKCKCSSLPFATPPPPRLWLQSLNLPHRPYN